MATGTPDLKGSSLRNGISKRHVLEPFAIPKDWMTLPGHATGASAVPFSVGWWATVQDDMQLSRKAAQTWRVNPLSRYYGMVPGKPNVGLKATVEEVAKEIVLRETDPDSRPA